MSTMPVSQLAQILEPQGPKRAAELRHTRTHVVGIGVRGTLPPLLRDRFWFYTSLIRVFPVTA
ncbi:MAG: hypothetical protein R3C19_22525 [Planctomycetaceae bacterium]